MFRRAKCFLYFVIRATSDLDRQIIDRVYRKKKCDLNDAVWAPGIVTGDNKKKLFDVPKDDFEPIYTGKEITPFKLKKAKSMFITTVAIFNKLPFIEITKEQD